MIGLGKANREFIAAIAGRRKQGMVGGLILIGVGFIERWMGKSISLDGCLYGVVGARLSDLASEQTDSILYVSDQCYPRGCRIENIHRVRLPYTVPSVVISLVIGSPMENFGSRN